jgi:FdhD protein
MPRLVFAFEERIDGIGELLSYMPLAARRALDAAGSKISLDAWRAMSLAERRELTDLGGAPVVDAPAVHASCARATPPGTEVPPSIEPASLPATVVEALGEARPIDAARWSALSPLERYVLWKCARKPTAKLGHAYDEIVRAPPKKTQDARRHLTILSPPGGDAAGADAAVTELSLLAVTGASASTLRDPVAVEEPLEIRAAGPDQLPVSISVTMRTPGHDDELAAGFLFTEGLVRSAKDLCDPPVRELRAEGGTGAVVTVHLAAAFDAERLKRNFYATSSCGVCGKASIDHIFAAAPPIPAGGTVRRSTLIRLPAALRAAQEAFARTGGLHATGVFDREGALLVAREDVGRHNAMDKAIGHLVLAGQTPLAGRVLMVSGRLSFELVQKAAMAGAPVLCGVSAPSSLAVQTAERLGMTLIGFLRGESFNVYTRPERVDLSG